MTSASSLFSPLYPFSAVPISVSHADWSAAYFRKVAAMLPWLKAQPGYAVEPVPHEDGFYQGFKGDQPVGQSCPDADDCWREMMGADFAALERRFDAEGAQS